MNQNDSNDEQLKPEQFNMKLLQFLIENPSYWNINQITQKASKKTLNYNRVKKSIIYFTHKKFVKRFSDLPINEQQIERNKANREISDDSYKINIDGEDVFKKIMTSCLDLDGQRLLSLRKIE